MAITRFSKMLFPLKVLDFVDKHRKEIILGDVFQHAKTWQRSLPNVYNLEERGDLGAHIFGSCRSSSRKVHLSESFSIKFLLNLRHTFLNRFD